MSIASGKLPTYWKSCLVAPIPKEVDNSDLSNCRPISLLQILSKVLEHHIGKPTLWPLRMHPSPLSNGAFYHACRQNSLMFNCLSFTAIREQWDTLSNAFWRSKKMAHTLEPLSRVWCQSCVADSPASVVDLPGRKPHCIVEIRRCILK